MARSTADSTVLIGVGMLLAARSIHWFITPMRHPRAGVISHAGMWFALVVALGLIGYGFYTRHRERSGALTD